MIIWVTSFNEILYNVTGKAMLESFYKTQSEGRMWINYDGDKEYVNPYFHIHESGNLYALDNNPILQRFIQDNKHIIPEKLGGLAKPCSCSSNPEAKKEKYHKPKCHYTYFNRNLLRWFKVYVGLNEARKLYPDAIIIRVDSDCVFKKQITEKWIKEILENNNILYFKGKREYTETGITVYNFTLPETHEFFDNLMQYYINGDFRYKIRWDDCFAFDLIRQTYHIKYKDLAKKMTGHNDVIPNSILGKYIDHNKGTHSRILNLTN